MATVNSVATEPSTATSAFFKATEELPLVAKIGAFANEQSHSNCIFTKHVVSRVAYAGAAVAAVAHLTALTVLATLGGVVRIVSLGRCGRNVSAANTIRKTPTILFMCIVMCVNPWADRGKTASSKGIVAADTQDTSQSVELRNSTIEELTVWAEVGDPDSCLALARVHQKSESLNLEKSYKLYLEAASQGQAEAMVEVGIALASGVGVERNDDEAVVWFSKAASPEKNNAQAKYCLGHMTSKGRGVLEADSEMGASIWFGESFSEEEMQTLRSRLQPVSLSN